jgi:large subunit ribosomal protein L28
MVAPSAAKVNRAAERGTRKPGYAQPINRSQEYAVAAASREDILQEVIEMAARCDVCKRRPQYGHNVSHSNRKTNRRFLVNVQHRRVAINGVVRNVYICTRCLRNMVKVPKTRTKAAKA